MSAFLAVHPRALGAAQPSTRYRDLADLALIAHTQTIAADELRRALASEVRRRGLELPPGLPSPEAAGWRAGYARVARDVPGLPERELEAALATVRRLSIPYSTGPRGHLGSARADVVGVRDHRLTAPVAREQTAVPDRLE